MWKYFGSGRATLCVFVCVCERVWVSMLQCPNLLPVSTPWHLSCVCPTSSLLWFNKLILPLQTSRAPWFTDIDTDWIFSWIQPPAMPPPDGCSINSAASDESEDTEPLIGSDESEENIFLHVNLYQKYWICFEKISWTCSRLSFWYHWSVWI